MDKSTNTDFDSFDTSTEKWSDLNQIHPETGTKAFEEDINDTQLLEEDINDTQVLEEAKNDTQVLEEDKNDTQVLEEDKNDTQVLEEDKNDTQVLEEDKNDTQVLEETETIGLEEPLHETKLFEETDSEVFEETEINVSGEARNETRVLEETETNGLEEALHETELFEETDTKVFEETENKVSGEARNETRVFEETEKEAPALEETETNGLVEALHETELFEETDSKVLEETENKVSAETRNETRVLEETETEAEAPVEETETIVIEEPVVDEVFEVINGDVQNDNSVTETSVVTDPANHIEDNVLETKHSEDNVLNLEDNELLNHSIDSLDEEDPDPEVIEPEVEYSDVKNEDNCAKMSENMITAECNGNTVVDGNEKMDENSDNFSEVSSEDSLVPLKETAGSSLPVETKPEAVVTNTNGKMEENSDNISEVSSEESPAALKQSVPQSPVTVKTKPDTKITTTRRGSDSRSKIPSFHAVGQIVHSCTSGKAALTRKWSSMSTADLKMSGKERPIVVPTDRPRENAASRMRMAASTKAPEPEPEPDYLTPLQRKDVIIKELKQQLSEAQRLSDHRAGAIEVEMDGQRFTYEEKLIEKDDLITKLDETLRDLEAKHQKVLDDQEETVRKLDQLTKEHQDLKELMEAKEKRHQEIYLEMYNKGRESAQFERRDELFSLAESGKETVTVAELLEKLKITEKELEWWQSARRDELYKETALPETSADATLRFLRDSMYHYLMGGTDSERHLQAIISIFKYTDTQLRNIQKSSKRKKSSS